MKKKFFTKKLRMLLKIILNSFEKEISPFLKKY